MMLQPKLLTIRDPIIEFDERCGEIIICRQAGMTYKEIGRRLGVPRERVRQMEARHIRKYNAYDHYKEQIESVKACPITGVKFGPTPDWYRENRPYLFALLEAIAKQ